MAFKENIKLGQSYNILKGEDPETGEYIYDQASLWTLASDVTFENGRSITSDFEYAEGYLGANDTDITIKGTNITQNGMLDIYLPPAYFHIFPTCIKQQAGSVYMVFPPTRVPKYQVYGGRPDDNYGGMNIRVVCHDSKAAFIGGVSGLDMYHVTSIVDDIIYTDMVLSGDMSDHINMMFALSTSKEEVPVNNKPYRLAINCRYGTYDTYEEVIFQDTLFTGKWYTGAEKDSVMTFAILKNSEDGKIYPVLQYIDYYGTKEVEEEVNSYPIQNPYTIVYSDNSILRTNIEFTGGIDNYLERDIVINVPNNVSVSDEMTRSLVLEVDGIYQTIDMKQKGGAYYFPDAIAANSVMTVRLVYEDHGYQANVISIVGTGGHSADPTITIVPWSNGAVEDIVAMVEAADAGMLDLTECWSVGQERIINLGSNVSSSGTGNSGGSGGSGSSGGSNLPSEEDPEEEDPYGSSGEATLFDQVTLVIVALDTKVENKSNPCYNYQYVSATSDRTYPSLIIQQKDLLDNVYAMDNSDANAAVRGWSQSLGRTLCNVDYYNSFPSLLFPIVKRVVVQSWNYNSDKQTTNDYFFFASAAEVFNNSDASGYNTTPDWTNLALWQYYNTASNRIKQRLTSGMPSNYNWWLRSSGSASTKYNIVSSRGSISDENASNSYIGAAVAFCI